MTTICYLKRPNHSLTKLTEAPAKALALSIDADDIDGLESFIENVVEDCSVQGEAYIYSREYAELEGVSISC